MKRLLLAVLLVFSTCANAQLVGGISTPDPFLLTPGNGQLPGSTDFTNPNGKSLQSSTLSFPTQTAVIITTWQSNIENIVPGTYTTQNTLASNFNIYDSGIYACANPVLGTPAPNPGNVNSANCQIADNLINAGTYKQVIMVTMAVGGTLCSDWATGSLRTRITKTIGQLAKKGLTVNSGFQGQTWILFHGGEQDAFAGTPEATLATCIRNYAQAFTTDGLSNFRVFIPTESMTNFTTNATVTAAQADAVASGCPNCRQGFNMDSLTGSFRQADGTHMSTTGAVQQAAGDTTVITNCKNSSC